MKARVLSKRQRERKVNRRRLNEIMGDRLQNWRNFVKKDNDARMTEEERDRKEGDRLVNEFDRDILNVSQDMEAESIERLPNGDILMKNVKMTAPPKVSEKQQDG